jgi:hypothetical protein
MGRRGVRDGMTRVEVVGGRARRVEASDRSWPHDWVETCLLALNFNEDKLLGAFF